MFYNKKGNINTIVVIISLLLAAVFIILATTNLSKGASRGADIEACRNWAVTQSFLKEPTTGIILKDLESPCVTFKDKLKGNKYEVYETLAKGMHDVWKMYGKGESDFYSDWNWGFDKNTHCRIGDEISIEKKELKVDEIDLDGFEEYLSDTYLPNSEQTYAEFFMNAKGAKIDFGSRKIDLVDNDKIYILFTVKKMPSLEGVLTKSTKFGVLGCVIGGGIGGAVGTVTIPIPLVGTAIGAVKGCGWGLLASGGISVASIAGQADKLYPGLIVISGEDASSLKEKCDGGFYYKPK